MLCVRYTPSVYEFIIYITEGRVEILYFNFRKSIQPGILRCAILCFVWILFLLLGVLIALKLPRIDRISMNATLLNRPPLSVAFFVTCLPVLFCLVSVWRCWFVSDYFLVAFEALCRGLCSFWFFLTYGNGAWLLRAGFMFSSVARSVLLWWLILSHNMQASFTLKASLPVILVSLFIITVVDSLLVTPLFIHLFMYI